MSEFFRSLQFFGEGGGAGASAGGDGADAGAAGVDAGIPGQEDDLEALGIPKDEADHFRKVRSKMQPKAAEPKPAAEVADPEPAPAQQKISWDDFMADPDNNKQLQTMISERIKQFSKSSEPSKAQMKALDPALKLLSQKYGIDLADGKVNIEGLVEAITGDDSFYEDEAIRMGTDNATAREIMQLRAEKAEAERVRAAQAQDEMLRQHVMDLQRQADKLRETWPDFDLQAELENPLFYERTLPGKNMSLEDVLWSLHGKEMAQKQAEALAKKTELAMSNKIASGRSRPQENGGISSPPVQKKVDRSSFNSMDEYQEWIMKNFPPVN